MLSQGVVLNDRYLLNDPVATGGMGEVWSATDTLLGRRVAVKVLLPSLVSDAEFITRFRTEARLMAALRHPGIVAVYDYGEDALVDDRRVDYLVMEYIEGVPLSKRIRAAGRLSVPETVSVLVQAAQALHVAHSASIVHRDVKPSNLLVQPDGSVVLVDFGVARSANVTSITGTNVVLGTVQYMAPEQIAGRPVSAATDVYALGAVAYCCLTGRPPFPGANPLHVVTQHLQDQPPALPPEVPAPIAALVTRALAKEPDHRYPTAAAFAEAARAAQDAASPPRAADGTGGTVAGSTVALGTHLRTEPRPGTAPNPVGVPMAGPAPMADPAAVGPPPVGPPPVVGPAVGGGADRPAGGRRRSAVLAGVAAVLVVSLIGLVGFVLLRSGPDASPGGSTTQARVGPSISADPGDAGSARPAPRVTTTGRSNPSASAPGPGDAPLPASQAGRPSPSGEPGPGTPGTTPPTPGRNPHTPGQVCGPGYEVIDSATLTGPGGVLQGRVYLLYNDDNGNNCTVALKATGIGTASAVSAYLEVQGRARSTDSGSYEYYAGPVRASAAGICVKWGGTIGGISYGSPFEHCD